MLMAHFGRVAIAVHDHVPPTDEEWDRWLNAYEGRNEARALIESNAGVGPNARQRKILAERSQGKDVRAAILTGSLVVRGIVTAVAWLGIPQRAFPPDHFRQAGEFLGLTSEELTQAVEELYRLREVLKRTPAAFQTR